MMERKEVIPRPLWVFGYGSLLWNPGFEVVEARLAELQGFRRRFCMWSIHHRGTEEDPGLVLALEPHEPASCHGMALRVADADADAVVTYLRERELVSSAYVETVLPLTMDDGQPVAALAYVMDKTHVQYTGDMTLERQAEVIAGATGGMGPNCEYLWNTASRMKALGIRDDEVFWLSDRVAQMLK